MKRTYIYCNLFKKMIEFDRYWKITEIGNPFHGEIVKLEGTIESFPRQCPCKWKETKCKNPMLFVEQGKQGGWRASN